MRRHRKIDQRGRDHQVDRERAAAVIQQVAGRSPARSRRRGNRPRCRAHCRRCAPAARRRGRKRVDLIGRHHDLGREQPGTEPLGLLRAEALAREAHAFGIAQRGRTRARTAAPPRTRAPRRDSGSPRTARRHRGLRHGRHCRRRARRCPRLACAAVARRAPPGRRCASMADRAAGRARSGCLRHSRASSSPHTLRTVVQMRAREVLHVRRPGSAARLASTQPAASSAGRAASERRAGTRRSRARFSTRTVSCTSSPSAPSLPARSRERHRRIAVRPRTTPRSRSPPACAGGRPRPERRGARRRGSARAHPPAADTSAART